jgi:PAS domain S-box-containing protein
MANIVHHNNPDDFSGKSYSRQKIKDGAVIKELSRNTADKKISKSKKQQPINKEVSFKKLVENSYEGITLFDKDLKIIYRSNSAKRITGWNATDRKKSSTAELTHPDDREAVKAMFDDLLKKPGKSVTCSFRSLHFDGHYLWLECIFTNLLKASGINAVVCNFRDITELRQKNQQIEGILSSINDGFIMLDENLCYTYANKQIGKMIGRPPETLIGQNIWDVFPDAVGSNTYHTIMTGLREKKYICEEDFYEPLRLWQENRVYPSTNGISVFIRDITQRKEAELTAHQLLNERNTILESIGDAFFAVDKDWTVTYWNKTAEKVLHCSREEIVGHHLWDKFADAIGSASYLKYNEALATQQAVHFEDHYPPLKKWYEISAYPTGNGLSVYFKDITERKLSEIHLAELNEDLKKKAKELAISNAELEQFAYVASHDLQEPLRMVTSFLTQLERKYHDIIDDKGKQYIGFAVDGAKRMRQIILDLLEFSRVGGIAEDLENVNLNNTVTEIIHLYHKKIEDEDAKVIFTYLPVLYTYKTPMRQVLQNLISNALKYRKRDESVVIEISAVEHPQHWEILVKDNGIGIEQEYYSKIFIIFQQLNPKNEYPGTGMGLAIAKKIIENLGGQIWVESKQGMGSTFHFTILKNSNNEINQHSVN